MIMRARIKYKYLTLDRHGVWWGCDSRGKWYREPDLVVPNDSYSFMKGLA